MASSHLAALGVFASEPVRIKTTLAQLGTFLLVPVAVGSVLQSALVLPCAIWPQWERTITEDPRRKRLANSVLYGAQWMYPAALVLAVMYTGGRWVGRLASQGFSLPDLLHATASVAAFAGCLLSVLSFVGFATKRALRRFGCRMDVWPHISLPLPRAE